MVRQDRVIGQQPVGQFSVKGRQIVKQEILMIIHALFLESAVKAFDMSIHFRGTGVSPPVGDAALLQAGVELSLELGAILGEHGTGRAGERRGPPARGRLGRPRASRRRGVCRILSGARAISRPRVETLGRSTPCCVHHDRTRMCSLGIIYLMAFSVSPSTPTPFSLLDVE